jgi:hypothetical protein
VTLGKIWDEMLDFTSRLYRCAAALLKFNRTALLHTSFAALALRRTPACGPRQSSQGSFTGSLAATRWAIFLFAAAQMHAQALSLEAYNHPNPIICTDASGKLQSDPVGLTSDSFSQANWRRYNDPRYQMRVFACASDNKADPRCDQAQFNGNAWKEVASQQPNYAGVSPRWLVTLSQPRVVAVKLVPYIFDTVTKRWLTDNRSANALSLTWKYGGACPSQTSPTPPVTGLPTEDKTADFVWDGVLSINQYSPKTELTGTAQNWTYKGTDYRGVQVTCTGGASSIRCNATSPQSWTPPQAWQCTGKGKLDWNYSIFAGGWAWFGVTGEADKNSGTFCDGTKTGLNGTYHSGLLYIRSKLPH